MHLTIDMQGTDWEVRDEQRTGSSGRHLNRLGGVEKGRFAGPLGLAELSGAVPLRWGPSAGVRARKHGGDSPHPAVSLGSFNELRSAIQRNATPASGQQLAMMEAVLREGLISSGLVVGGRGRADLGPGPLGDRDV